MNNVQTIKEQFMRNLQNLGPTFLKPSDDDLLRIVCELADEGKCFIDDSKLPVMISLPVNIEYEAPCPYRACDGELDYQQDECYCHAGNAPCCACEGGWLECTHCQVTEGDLLNRRHSEEFDKNYERKKFSGVEGSW